MLRLINSYLISDEDFAAQLWLRLKATFIKEIKIFHCQLNMKLLIYNKRFWQQNIIKALKLQISIWTLNSLQET